MRELRLPPFGFARPTHDLAAHKLLSARTAAKQAAAPTVDEAREVRRRREKRLLDLWIKDGRAQWVHETYITDDTEQMAADADEAVKAATAELATQARRFEGLKLPEDVARKFKLMKFSVDIPAPRDPALSRGAVARSTLRCDERLRQRQVVPRTGPPGKMPGAG